MDALAARFGGTAYAAVNLARQLSLRPEIADVTVITRRGSIVQRGLARDDGVACVSLAESSRFELVRRVAWEALRLPSVTAPERCDAVISMSGMLPRLPHPRVICLLFNPVMYEASSSTNLLRRRAVRRTVRRASFVAGPSSYMAELVATSTGRECAVIPLGVDHTVFAPAASAGKEILYVADFYPHKRHDLILDAWLLLPSPRPVLHLVGNPAVNTRLHRELLTRIREMPESGSIVLSSGISLERLVAAYHRARVFVAPSERESFCMPLVESMACGVPAVVRGIPSLRETGGAGARYVHGDDPAGWAAAMRQLLEDAAGHERARDAAVEAAAGFSWSAMAARVAEQL
jgi:glycosyltransferase involved in cell wall biosynthesis